jgi:hypothetical protein
MAPRFHFAQYPNLSLWVVTPSRALTLLPTQYLDIGEMNIGTRVPIHKKKLKKKERKKKTGPNFMGLIQTPDTMGRWHDSAVSGSLAGASTWWGCFAWDSHIGNKF